MTGDAAGLMLMAAMMLMILMMMAMLSSSSHAQARHVALMARAPRRCSDEH